MSLNFIAQGSETNNLDYTVCDHESNSLCQGDGPWPGWHAEERELTNFSQQEIVASILQ